MSTFAMKNFVDKWTCLMIAGLLILGWNFGNCSSDQIGVRVIDVHNFTISNSTSETQIEESLDKFEVQSENSKMNFSLRPIIAEEENIVNFNISWTETEIALEGMEIHIRDIICKRNKHIYVKTISKIDLSSAFVIAPSKEEMFEIKPSCVYTITIIARKDKDQVWFNDDFNYTVPDCVDGLCNCSKFHPINNTFQVDQVSENRFQVAWQLHPIENIGLYNLSFDLVNGTHHVPADYIYLKSIDSSENDFWNGNVTLTIDRTVFVEGTNELLATFLTNLTDCEFRYDVQFNATRFFDTTEETSSFLLLCVFVMVVVMVVIVFCFCKYKKHDLKKYISGKQNDIVATYIPVPVPGRKAEHNPFYVDKEIIAGDTDRYEFPISHLKIFNNIGGGAFGEVFLGQAFAIGGCKGYTNVAVKRLRAGAPPEEVLDFITEINILKRIPEHQHIVALFGCCTLKEPYMMIMEFVPCGDLRKYLLNLRKEWQNRRSGLNSIDSPSSDGDCSYITQPSVPGNWHLLNNSISTTISNADSDVPSVATGYTTVSAAMSSSTASPYVPVPLHLVLDSTELQNFSLQIARGMEHLEKIPITHRDLAARNILINEFKMLKISDFGMSRSGPYVNRYLKKIPLRWNALEAIDKQFYDSKSDVWSFGVVLWEIGTLGAFPYQRIPDDLLFPALRNGLRLERPEVCTDHLYALMLRCWAETPERRPSFGELVQLLDNTDTEADQRAAYIDFRDISASYVFPPAAGRRDSRQDAPRKREEVLQQQQQQEEELRLIEEEKEEMLVEGERTGVVMDCVSAVT